jgi:hypothetical protein
MLTWAGVALVTLSSVAQAAPFTGYGLYHHGTVDSIENVLILPDHSFCIAVTAGALDLLAAGRWTSVGDQIVLDEVKHPAAPVIVAWKVSARPEDRGKVIFDFGGQSFGSQGSFLFGTSTSDRLPTDIRPLFSAQANGFEQIYTDSRPAGIKTFVFAYRPQEQRGQGPYHLLQYRLPETPPGAGLRLRSYYDKQAANPPIHLTGGMSDGVLKLGEQSFGRPAPIGPNDRATCMAALKKAEGDGGGVTPPGVNLLQPAHMSDGDLTRAASAKPLFKTSYDEPNAPR